MFLEGPIDLASTIQKVSFVAAIMFFLGTALPLSLSRFSCVENRRDLYVVKGMCSCVTGG